MLVDTIPVCACGEFNDTKEITIDDKSEIVCNNCFFSKFREEKELSEKESSILWEKSRPRLILDITETQVLIPIPKDWIIEIPFSFKNNTGKKVKFLFAEGSTVEFD